MKVIHEIETFIEQATRTPAEQTLKYLDIEAQGISQLNNLILEKIDLPKKMYADEYKASKKLYQQKLTALQYELFKKKRSLIVVFEGWDERVKGFCSESEWKRAYREINEFEETLIQAGSIVLKV